MMSKMLRFAVIDLGTNTFTMLIAEIDQAQNYDIIYHDRAYVKLAQDGIKTIGEVPFRKAVEILTRFEGAIQKHNVKQVKALGTAALRTASNGQALVEEIFSKTGIAVDIIDGDQEAMLIYEGVKLAYPMTDACDLIMDIGGGSVEFIIANNKKLFWTMSFPVGVAVLKNKFHHHDPIATEEYEDLINFLAQQLAPLFEEAKAYNLRNLVGASGTFDIIEKLFLKNRWSSVASEVDVDDILPFFDKVIHLTLQERKEMSTIPDERVDMIVVALILIKFIIEKFNFKHIGISAYAMKEGMMSLLAKAQ